MIIKVRLFYDFNIELESSQQIAETSTSQTSEASISQTNKTSTIHEYAFRNIERYNYKCFEDSFQKKKVPMSKDVPEGKDKETYVMHSSYMSIGIEKKELSTDYYLLTNLLDNDDEQTVSFYANFFGDNEIDIKKNRHLYFMKYFLYLQRIKDRDSIESDYGKGAVFAIPLEYRLSDEGQEASRKSSSNRHSLYSLCIYFLNHYNL